MKRDALNAEKRRNGESVRRVRLGEVCKRTITGEWGGEVVEGRGVCVLRTTNFVNDGSIDFSNVVRRDISELKIADKHLVPGDIIVEKSGGTKDNPVGRVVYFTGSNEQCLCNNFTQIIRSDENQVVPRYLFYTLRALYLMRVTETLYNKTTGIQNLQMKKYMLLELPLPPLAVQRKIAAELDRICALKRTAEKTVEKLRVLVKARFVEMFGDGQKNERDWNIRLMGEMLEIERGGSPRPIDKYITDSEEGVNWIKIGDAIPGDIYIRSVKEKILPSGTTKSRKVNPGDFLLSNSMSFGRPYITLVEGYVHDGWLVLRDGRGSFDKLFLHQLLSSQCVFGQFERLASGSTVKNLNKELVSRIMIPVPPLPLQREFAAFVAKVEKLEAAAKRAAERLDVLYRAKLQEYFA